MRNERDMQSGTASTSGATDASTSGSMSGSTSGSTSGSMGASATSGASGSASGGAKDMAKEQMRSGLDMGKQRAAGALQGVAASLRRSCEEQQDGATRYLMQAGDRVQQAADYLERTDVREMVTHTERFARRQPAIFLGAAFTLGLVAARFLKSSQRHDGARADDASASGWEGGAYDREQPLRSYREGVGQGAASAYGASSSAYGTAGSMPSGTSSYGAGASSRGASPVGPTTPLGASSSGGSGSGVSGSGVSGSGVSGSGTSTGGAGSGSSSAGRSSFDDPDRNR